VTGRDGGGPEQILGIEHVTVSFSGREILHDVNLDVRQGEFTGLIGSNGAGKTTLLRIILGLVTPTSGRVLINGKTGRRQNRLVGYVPQSVELDPDMPLRGRDVVALGIDGHRLGLPLPSASRRRLVDDVLEAVDATRFADARVGNLSGGEQQRILIAHALVGKPRLLLLDEPLANLDIPSEQGIVDVLSRIAREQGIAVLISTHDMNPLMPAMDRIAYVAAGRVASGTTKQVVSTESLSQLYGHHVDVIHVHDRVLVVAGRGDGVGGHLAPEHVEWVG
jgi:zinc/manganese transport system ATP-binding protein